jgi:hypothetical protein
MKRVAELPEKHLYLRICDKCGEEMLSVYPVIVRDEAIHNEDRSPKLRSTQLRDDAIKVYCEDCYKQEVYG